MTQPSKGLWELLEYIAIRLDWVTERSKDKPFNPSTQAIKDSIIQLEISQCQILLGIAKEIHNDN